MKKKKFESILNTATKLFARYGFRKTSLDDVARMARVAKGTIYNYFGDKDQVYKEVLRQEGNKTLGKIISAVEKETAPDKKLHAFATAKFQYMRQALNILHLDQEGVENLLPGVETIRNDLFKREVEIICSILKEGEEKGIFFLSNRLITANAIGHALRGFELNWLLQESEQRIEHYLSELINILFFGLMSEKKANNENIS